MKTDHAHSGKGTQHSHSSSRASNSRKKIQTLACVSVGAALEGLVTPEYAIILSVKVGLGAYKHLCNFDSILFPTKDLVLGKESE